MTVEEKLEKAVSFIKTIERLDTKNMTLSTYAETIDELSNNAWHVLAEITD